MVHFVQDDDEQENKEEEDRAGEGTVIPSNRNQRPGDVVMAPPYLRLHEWQCTPSATTTQGVYNVLHGSVMLKIFQD